MLQIEYWKGINGYENYEVSNFGNVRRKGKNKILKPMKTEAGYFRVGLYCGKVMKKKLINRLVAIAFIPNPENKPEVNHKDGIKTNNYDWNLEWNTKSENQQHAFNTGLSIGKKGESHPLSRLKEEDIHSIRNSSLKLKFLSEKYNLSITHVCAIRKKRKWGHI